MTKDCGCGQQNTVQSARQESISSRTGEASKFGDKGTASPDRPQLANEGAGAGVDVEGPIVQLNAVNGLFLKAAHLDVMQGYSKALSEALGIALGVGVVYGFELSIKDNVLIATEGLAITPTGRPLQSGRALKLPLQGDYLPPLGQDGFWLIVLEPDFELAGSENAYGNVCAEPCEGIGTIQPWINSQVRLRLLKQTMAGLETEADKSQRRNWLASKYFEKERELGYPWVVPRVAGAGVELLVNPWYEGGGAPKAAAVPIGVLQKVDAAFVLDTWTARREVNGPPGAVRWDGHLARRSWPVFLAQVLQFQDQFKSEYDAQGKPLQARAGYKRRDVTPQDEVVKMYFSSVEGTAMSDLKNFQKFQASWHEAERAYSVLPDAVRLVDLGFVELPPAGYLGGIEFGHEHDQVEYFFDDMVELRFCNVRADYVAGAIQAAQHLDRIPLTHDTDPLPKVDILVPTIRADLKSLQVDSYGWVAFVRRSAASCEEENGEKPEEGNHADSVEIFVSQTDPQDSLERLMEGDMTEGQPSIVQAMYAKGTAKLQPAPPAPNLAELIPIAVVGVASTAAEEPLTRQRAKALAKAWQLEPKPTAVVGTVSRPFIVIFVKSL